MRIECENCNAAYTIGDALLSDQPIGAQCPYCGHVRIVRKGDPPSLGKKPSLPAAPGGSSLSMGLGSKPPPPPPPSTRPGSYGATPPGLQALPRGQSGLDADLGGLGPGPGAGGAFSDRFAPPPGPATTPGGAPTAAGGARCQVCSTELTDEFDKVIGLCETHQRERSGTPDFGAKAGAAGDGRWKIRSLDGTVKGPITLAELKSGLEDNIYGEEDEFSRDDGDFESMDKFHELRPFMKSERGIQSPRSSTKKTQRTEAKPFVPPGGGIGAGTVMMSLLVLALAAGGAYLMMHPELIQGFLASLPSGKDDVGPVPPNPLKRHLDKWRLANPDASGTADEHLVVAEQRMLEDTVVGHQQAQDSLQRALLLDEDNAVAIAAYAENLVLWRGQMLTEEELTLVDGATRYAVAVRPDHAGAHRARAAYGLAKGDPNAMRTPAEKALSLNSGDGLARLYIAASYLEGNPSLSVREAESAADSMPALRRADRVLARAYANAGRYGAAMKRIDKRLSVEPNSAVTHWLKGDIEREVGNLAGAKASYTKAIQLDPEDFGPRVALGELLLSLNDPRGATETYRVIVEGTKPVPAAYRLGALAGLARAELWFGRPQRVVEYATAAVNIDKEHAASLLALADVTMTTGSSTEAESLAQRVLAVRAGEPAALVILGRVGFLTKRPEIGMGRLEEAIQNDPRSIILRGLQAGAYLSLGGNLQAFTLMRRASEMDPTDSASGGKRGLYAVPEIAIKESLERFRDAAKDVPDRSVALSSAAMVQYQLGNLTEARTLLAEALEADDANVGALLYTAQMALDRGAYREAEENARKMFRVERGSAIGWLTVGRALMGQNKHKEAVEAFDTALRSQKGLLVAEVERAAAKMKLGDIDEAKETLKSAYERNPHLVRTRRLLLEAGE